MLEMTAQILVKELDLERSCSGLLEVTSAMEWIFAYFAEQIPRECFYKFAERNVGRLFVVRVKTSETKGIWVSGANLKRDIYTHTRE
jgi:hypothetical protein